MDLSGLDYSDEIIYDPTYFNDHVLLNISLRGLSRTIAPSLPMHSTLPIYVRWLCLHRDNPSSVTEHWLNTVQQWVHSLRKRDCYASEMDHALESRRQEYLLNMKAPWDSYAGRPLPSTADIFRWFQNPSVEGYRNSRDQADFHKAPPGDYVCNRCDKKGHFVQVCPTNLDPAFDKPPHRTYYCPLCYLNGAHYKSLCPMNSDPFSLTQQRKEHERSKTNSRAYGRQLGGSSRKQAHFGSLNDFGTVQSRDKMVHSTEPTRSFGHEPVSVQTPRESSADRMHGIGSTKTTQDRDVAESIDKKRGRQMTVTSSRSSNDGSPTPDRKQSLRKRIRRIKDYEDKLMIGKALASTQIDLIRRKAKIEKELKVLNQNRPGQMDVTYEDEVPLAGHLHRPSVSSDGSGRGSLDSMSVDQPNTPSGLTPIPTRAAFIQKLMQLRTKEMTEVVNVVKQRPTALAMWLENSAMRADEKSPEALADPFWGDTADQDTENPMIEYMVQNRQSDEKSAENMGGDMDLMRPQSQPLVSQVSPTLAANYELIEEMIRIEISKSQTPKGALKDLTNSPKRDISKRGDPFAAVYKMALPDQKTVPRG